MSIRAWKGTDDPTYIVQVGDDMYEMDERANMPNGVCIYIGPISDLDGRRGYLQHMVPMGIVRQIVNLTGRKE